MTAYVPAPVSCRSPTVSLRNKFQQSNIPASPVDSRDVMRTVSMVNDSVKRNSANWSENRSNITALRQQMAAHNFKMGSIVPEHHVLDLQPKRLSVQEPLRRNALQTNAHTIVASGVSVFPSLGCSGQFKTIN